MVQNRIHMLKQVESSPKNSYISKLADIKHLDKDCQEVKNYYLRSNKIRETMRIVATKSIVISKNHIGTRLSLSIHINLKTKLDEPILKSSTTSHDIHSIKSMCTHVLY